MTSCENRCSRTVVLASSVIGEKPSSWLTQLVASALWNTPGAEVLKDKYVRDAFVSFEVQPQVYEFERVDTARLPEPSEILTDVLSTDIAPSPKHFEYSFPNAGSSIPKSYHSLIEYVDKNYPRLSPVDEKEKARILVKASIFRYRREREELSPTYQQIITTSIHAPLQLLQDASTAKKGIQRALNNLNKYTKEFDKLTLEQFKNLSNHMIQSSTSIISQCSSNLTLANGLLANLLLCQSLSADLETLQLSLNRWSSQIMELLGALSKLIDLVGCSVYEFDAALTHLLTLPNVTLADPTSGLASAKYVPFKSALNKFAYPLWSDATTGTSLTQVIADVKMSTTDLDPLFDNARAWLLNPTSRTISQSIVSNLQQQIDLMKQFAIHIGTTIGDFENQFRTWKNKSNSYIIAYEEMNKVSQAFNDLPSHDFDEGYSLLYNWCDVADLYWEWAIKMIEQRSWIVDIDLERKVRLLAFAALLAARVDKSVTKTEYPSEVVLSDICLRALYTLKKIDDLLKFKSICPEGLLERVLKDAISIYETSSRHDALKALRDTELDNLNKQFDKESEPLLK